MLVRKTRPDVVRGGFTLLEILVVVAIIVVLAGVGGMALLNQIDTAKEKRAYMDAKDLAKAAQVYKINNGDYPSTLAALAQVQPNQGPPLIKQDLLNDPWGVPYQYDPAGRNNNGVDPDVWTVRNNKQIGNWAPPK